MLEADAVPGSSAAVSTSAALATTAAVTTSAAVMPTAAAGSAATVYARARSKRVDPLLVAHTECLHGRVYNQDAEYEPWINLRDNEVAVSAGDLLYGEGA